MKVRRFTMQNVKGVNAFDFEFNPNGVNVIGGRNNQGKTSVLDGIAYALGGERMRPTNYRKMDSDGEPYMRCELDNGIVVERIGESADLRVIDETGTKKGQRLLDTFITSFALDVPKFINGTERERNEALLQALGLGDELDKIDEEEQTEYEERTIIGRIADQKKKAVKEMPLHLDVPEEEISASEILAKLAGVNARNAAIRKAKEEVEQNRTALAEAVTTGEMLAQQKNNVTADMQSKIAEVHANAEAQIAALQRQIEKVKEDAKSMDIKLHESAKLQEATLSRQIEANETTVADLIGKVEHGEKDDRVEEDTSELEAQLKSLGETNAKIRENKARAEKQKDADEEQRKYDEKTAVIEAIRRKREEILSKTSLPYPGLSYQNKHIYLDGKAWDCINESKKYIVACAIVMRINPNCKFVLMDKLEQMDAETLKEFDAWVKEHNLQVIAVRVTSNPDECTIIIKDGYIEGMEHSIIIPHKISRKSNSEKTDEKQSSDIAIQQTLPINDTPTAKALTQEFSAEREEAVSEDVGNAVKIASDAVARAKSLLAKRRGEIINSLGGQKNA